MCSQAQPGSATVTVNPLPTATITGTTAVCQNAVSPNIIFTGAGGTTPYTFTYTINSGSNQVIQTATESSSVSLPVPTNAVGSFTYSLVSVTDASSTSCSQAQTGTATVTINPLPSAIISGTTAVCQNAVPPVITFTGSGGTTPYTFTYNVNGGVSQTVATSSGSSTVTINAPTNNAGTFVYNLVSVQDGSITTCTQSQGSYITIIVNPLPAATISGTASTCKDASSPNVTFTGSGGTIPYTFTYNINGGSTQTVAALTSSSVTVPVSTASVGTFTYNLLSVRDGSSTMCQQAQTGSAVVTVNSLPSTSAITGPQTPACSATGQTYSVILTAGSTYAWTVPAEAVITSGGTGPNNNTITVNFGTKNGNVSVVETNGSGCAGSRADLPIGLVGCGLNADFSANTTIICNGNNVIFTNLSTGTTGSTTYSWNFGSGASPATATGMGPHTVTYTTTGTKTISLSVTEGWTDTETKNNYLTVNPLPTATIAGSATICQNSGQPGITFTGSGGTRPYTFTYNINGGGNSTVTTTLVSNSATVLAPTTTAGNFVYNLISVRDGTISACTQAQSGNATIIVNPLPNATISGTTSVCQNAGAPVITFTGSGGTTPYIFTYNINGGSNTTVSTTSGSSTVAITAPTTSSGTYVYNLVSVMDGSTTTCSQNQTGSATVTINPLPTATVTGTTAVCRNAPEPYITFTGSGGAAPYSFTYNINGGANQTITTTVGNSISLPVATSATGSYTYNLVSVEDGPSTECFRSVTGSATVTVNPLPTANITGTTAVCQNAPQPTITFTGAGGTTPYTFTYNINGGANQTVTSPDGSSIATVSAPTTGSGSFTYNLVSVRDGSSTLCSQIQSGSVTISVNPLPSATVSGTTTVCRNSASQTITFTGSGGTRPYTFTYTINSGGYLTISTTFLSNNASVTVPTGESGTFTYSLVSVSDGSSTTF